MSSDWTRARVPGVAPYRRRARVRRWRARAWALRGSVWHLSKRIYGDAWVAGIAGGLLVSGIVALVGSVLAAK